jgi:hypothetical protein
VIFCNPERAREPYGYKDLSCSGRLRLPYRRTIVFPKSSANSLEESRGSLTRKTGGFGISESYFPFHTGFRFSIHAAIPSCASSVCISSSR